MRTPTPHIIARSLGVLAVVTMASCSLPSPEDWRQIQTEGLIPYVMNRTPSEPAATEPASAPQMVAQVKTHPAPTLSPVVQASRESSPSAPSVPPPSQLRSDALLTAQAVPGLPGYVRSPFTNPPRLVDVRGMMPGSKVVCPYTRKPFIVPNAPREQPQQQVASTPPPAPLPKVQSQPAPAPRMTQQSTSTPRVTQQPASTAPTKVAANTTPAPQPPPMPQAKQTPAVQQTPPPPPATAELPFGVAIPGRPGFVNSPYAAKHQLVDVTGLPTGMEVKCPYTGKLFRVPPQANGTAPASKN
jgi:hypothetical protein